MKSSGEVKIGHFKGSFLQGDIFDDGSSSSVKKGLDATGQDSFSRHVFSALPTWNVGGAALSLFAAQPKEPVYKELLTGTALRLTEPNPQNQVMVAIAAENVEEMREGKERIADFMKSWSPAMQNNALFYEFDTSDASLKRADMLKTLLGLKKKGLAVIYIRYENSDKATAYVKEGENWRMVQNIPGSSSPQFSVESGTVEMKSPSAPPVSAPVAQVPEVPETRAPKNVTDIELTTTDQLDDAFAAVQSGKDVYVLLSPLRASKEQDAARLLAGSKETILYVYNSSSDEASSVYEALQDLDDLLTPVVPTRARLSKPLLVKLEIAISPHTHKKVFRGKRSVPGAQPHEHQSFGMGPVGSKDKKTHKHAHPLASAMRKKWSNYPDEGIKLVKPRQNVGELAPRSLQTVGAYYQELSADNFLERVGKGLAEKTLTEGGNTARILVVHDRHDEKARGVLPNYVENDDVRKKKAFWIDWSKVPFEKRAKLLEQLRLDPWDMWHRKSVVIDIKGKLEGENLLLENYQLVEHAGELFSFDDFKSYEGMQGMLPFEIAENSTFGPRQTRNNYLTRITKRNNAQQALVIAGEFADQNPERTKSTLAVLSSALLARDVVEGTYPIVFIQAEKDTPTFTLYKKDKKNDGNWEDRGSGPLLRSILSKKYVEERIIKSEKNQLIIAGNPTDPETRRLLGYTLRAYTKSDLRVQPAAGVDAEPVQEVYFLSLSLLKKEGPFVFMRDRESGTEAARIAAIDIATVTQKGFPLVFNVDSSPGEQRALVLLDPNKALVTEAELGDQTPLIPAKDKIQTTSYVVDRSVHSSSSRRVMTSPDDSAPAAPSAPPPQAAPKKTPKAPPPPAEEKDDETDALPIEPGKSIAIEDRGVLEGEGAEEKKPAVPSDLYHWAGDEVKKDILKRLLEPNRSKLAALVKKLRIERNAKLRVIVTLSRIQGNNQNVHATIKADTTRAKNGTQPQTHGTYFEGMDRTRAKRLFSAIENGEYTLPVTAGEIAQWFRPEEGLSDEKRSFAIEVELSVAEGGKKRNKVRKKSSTKGVVDFNETEAEQP